MTYTEREQIFSKEVLSLDDVMKLFDISKSAACTKVQDIKRQLGKDRIKIQGKLHILDYLEYLKIEDEKLLDRYKKPETPHSYDPTGFFSRGNYL